MRPVAPVRDGLRSFATGAREKMPNQSIETLIILTLICGGGAVGAAFLPTSLRNRYVVALFYACVALFSLGMRTTFGVLAK